MPDQPALKSLKISGLLSFSEAHLDLGPLNVLIGPNGSGKSNLIEIIGLLQSAPRDLRKPIWEGGGIWNWAWKGGPGGGRRTLMRLDALVGVETVVNYGEDPIRYRIEFDSGVGQGLTVVDERLENEHPFQGHEKPILYFGYENGPPMLNIGGSLTELRGDDIDSRQSVLAQRKDPRLYPELTYVGHLFESFRLYREWRFGRSTALRVPQPSDSPNDYLEENLDNLGLMLNKLRRDAKAKNDLLKYLKLFYEDAEDIDLVVEGGTVQVFLQEKNFVTPATRLSDGTLRWLCLLAILLHPSPPPLVCLEEPEIGFHPDMIPTLAELLRDASERMQLIVTTHSDTLVDALSEVPEAIVVFEKENGATTMRRLSRNELSVWLEKYSLGELWSSGEIGGNRW